MKETLDRLLLNGSIHTLRNEQDIAQALGIRDGKIVFVGTDADARARYDARECIDLGGKTVIPGMGDSHMHFYAFCQTLTTVDLGPCTSFAEVIGRLRAKAAVTPEGQWIKGSNFDQSKWSDFGDRMPTRHDLDAASTRHPIVIKRVCLHNVVANTLALETAGIGRDYAPGPGGIVEREADGYPNGVLREQLTKVFDELIPDPMNDPAVKKDIMVRQLRDMASLGMTMMHTYAADIWKYVEDVAVYDALDRAGLLPLRVTVYLDKLEKLEGHQPFTTDAQRADPKHKTQLGGYKLFCDGSLGSRSAALYEPYADDPGTSGIVVEDLEALERKMLRAAREGIQSATHAIGDRALDLVVTAVEHTVAELRKDGWSEEKIAQHPFRIIHAQLASDELIARMTRLPVVLDIQPAFFITDMHWVQDRLGPERMKTGYLWETYRQNGLLLTGGSDSPVESYNPMPAIYSCVTRQDLKGWPEGGMQPEERMSVYDALCMFSKNIPYATGDQDYMGTLEPGKFADLAVLDRNLFAIAPRDILNVRVERTMLAGQDTFVR